MTLLVLLLAAGAVAWLQVAAQPRPVRVRRNLRREEVLAAYIDARERSRHW